MKIVERFSSFRADLAVIDTQGRDCLHYAASKGSIEIGPRFALRKSLRVTEG